MLQKIQMCRISSKGKKAFTCYKEVANADVVIEAYTDSKKWKNYSLEKQMFKIAILIYYAASKQDGTEDCNQNYPLAYGK